MNDCASGVRWVAAHRAELGVSHLIVSGESGGGNLTLTVGHKAKREGWLHEIAGFYAQCPYISNRWHEVPDELPSLRECDGYFINLQQAELLGSIYDPDGAHSNDPTCFAGVATDDDLSGLPPHVISVNELDPMRDEGLDYYRRLVRAGVPAVGRVVAGTCHGGDMLLAGAMPDGSNYDLLIAGIASLCLIFIIMLIITRSVVASAVIVGTVLLSLGASFGLSVLIWQHLIGIELHWMVLAMSVIILLAVGADYNLLLVSRFKEEIHDGLNTGIIRSMGGTGSVVTSAGLVFAFTMMTMAVSQLTVIGQVGTTIGLGLLFDTLIVRSLMTPSIAALMGKWFWWPQVVRQRPKPSPWPAPLEKRDEPLVTA